VRGKATVSTDEEAFKNHVLPLLGERTPVADVTYADVERMHLAITTVGAKGKTGSPIRARSGFELSPHYSTAPSNSACAPPTRPTASSATSKCRVIPI